MATAAQVVAGTAGPSSAASAAASKIEWRKLNGLRKEQRDIASKIGLLENDLSETKLVTDALAQVDSKRKCYRLQGGVLVEHVVDEVIPALYKNKEHLETMITSAKKELTEKGKAIQTFMTENNISFRKQ